MKKWLKQELEKSLEQEFEKTKISFEEIKNSIKHPHFFYALVDMEKNKIIYKRKKWYKWFSGKREVCVKIIPFRVKGLEY